MNLFLDDIRQPYQVGNYILPIELRVHYRKLEWIIVRNYEEFIAHITENGLPELVSFDHDLADIHYDPSTWTEGFEYQEKTGYNCAKWLVDYCLDNNLKLPTYMVHSMNPIGKERINNLLENFLEYQ